MAIAAQKVGLFNRPVGFSLPEGTQPTLRDVRNYLTQSQKPSIYKRITYGTYGGLGLFLVGIISWFIGSKKDSSEGKWFGRITTLVGAATAAIGRLISLDSKPFEFVINKLLFQPSKELGSIPKEVQKQEVSIKTKDGETLHGYFLKAKKNTDKTIIYLHGNAGNVDEGWYRAGTEMQENVNANVLIVDYRGYGKSSGKPSREGVIKDARAMYEYLIKEKRINGSNISVFGKSMGGAIAVELAAKLKQENKPLRSLIIQSSFTSLRDVAKSIFPYIPGFIVRNDLLNSLELIKELNIPVLISHGDKDELIPHEQSKRLYETANEPKKLIILEGAHHNDTSEYYSKNEDYYKELKKLVGVE